MSGIEEHLLVAKDGYGNFYLPEWDFSNLGEMQEGRGYFVNVDQDIELVYNVGEDRGMAADGIGKQIFVYDLPGELAIHAITGSNMSLLVVSEPPLCNSNN